MPILFPGHDPILFLRDVRWLIRNCPEGKEISGTCTAFFLDLVEEDAPDEVSYCAQIAAARLRWAERLRDYRAPINFGPR